MKGIFRKRQQTSLVQNARYLPYVFNDHFILIMVIIIGYLAYLYAQNLSLILAINPLILRIGILVLFFLELHSFSLVTYLQDPDRNFLLPVLDHLRDTFKLATIYSLFIPIITFTFTTVFLTPLLHGLNSRFNLISGVSTICGLIFLQLGLFNCFQQKIYGKIKGQTFTIIRELILIGTLALVFLPQPWFFLGTALGELILLLLFDHVQPQGKLQVNYAIVAEEKRQSRILRFFGLFMDIPDEQAPVRRRKYLDFLKSAKHDQQNLFLLTFLRSGNYFGLFFRLCIINWLVIFFFKGQIVEVIVSLILIYLLLFQLIPIYQQTTDNQFFSFNPIKGQEWRHIFQKWLRQVGFTYVLINWIVMIVVKPTDYLNNLVFLVGGLLLTYLMTRFYFNFRMKRGKRFAP